MAGIGTTAAGTRMTMEDDVKWGVNCYRSLKPFLQEPEYKAFAAFCELAGDIDPDSRFEGPRAEITSASITKEYVQELEKKELEVRKLLIERLSPSDRVFIFHEVQHIIQGMYYFGGVRNIWSMEGERTLGGMVSQVHSKVVPDANLVSILQQSDNLRARAGLYQEGDDLLEHAATVPRLERIAKRLKNCNINIKS